MDDLATTPPTVSGNASATGQVPMNRKQATEGFAWTVGYTLIAKLVFPLLGIYISRTLGPAILGISALLQMTLSLSESIRDAGLNQTFMADSDRSDQKRSVYTGLSLITAAVPAVIVLLLSPFLATYFRQDELRWSLPVISLCLLLNGVSTIPNAMLLKNGMLKEQGRIAVTAAGLSVLTTAILVSLGVGFPALVLSMLMNSVLALGLTLKLQSLGTVSFERQLLKETFVRTRVLLATNLANNVFIFCDVFVIQRLVGTTASGLYNVAQNIAYKPADLLVFPLSKTLLVAFSQASEDQARLRRSYGRAIAVILMAITPLYAWIGFNSDAIILALLGSKFAGSIPVLAALTIYLAMRTLGTVSGTALVPAGKHQTSIYPWYAAVAITATSVAIVSRHPSMMGVVWSFVLGAAVAYTSLFVLGMRYVTPPPEIIHKIKKVLVITATTSAILGLSTQLPLNLFFRAGMTLLVFPLVQLALLGISFGTGPLAYASKSGLRELWNSL